MCWKVIGETGRTDDIIGIRAGFLDRVDLAGQWKMGKIYMAIRKVGRATQVEGTVSKVKRLVGAALKSNSSKEQISKYMVL